MMKKLLSIGLLSVLSALYLQSPAQASVYIKCYNKDSQKHVMKVQMDGSTKEVTFDASKTSAATIQGSGKKAIIETKCGNIEIKDDAKIEIKDGCIKFI